MPGIFGFVCQSTESAPADLFAGMAQRIVREPWYVEDRFQDPSGRVALGRSSLGIVDTARQPAGNDDESVIAILAGEIYDHAQQRRALESSGVRFRGTSHAELMVRGYESRGSDFAKGLHGKFAAAIWDRHRRKLILVNDRFGMKKLYFAHAGRRLLFATSIQCILADSNVSRDINRRGLAQFLTFGQLLGEDTLFDNVRELPAAGWLQYDADSNRVSSSRYWNLDAKPVIRKKTETLDRIDGAFAAAVERCAADADGLGISLSGGMDARSILAVAAKPGRSLITVTSGMPGNMDHRSASAMARLVGVPNHHVDLDEAFLANYESHLRRMVQLTDGQYLCQCIVLPTLPVYRNLGIRVLMRGHAGELMHMTKAYNFSLNRRALDLRDAELESWLWPRLQSYMLDGVGSRIFAASHRGEMESLARESLQKCLDKTAETGPPVHRISRLFLEQRLRRETALSMMEFDSVVETRLPYIDNELIDELFMAPPELKLGDVIQTHILRRRRPEFLNVVNVNTGTVVGAGAVRRSVSTFRKRVLAKLGVKGYQPYERLGLWLRRELRPLVDQLLLSERALGRGIFDADAVREVVADHLAERRNYTYLVLALMIFETFQQNVVERTSGCAGKLPCPKLGAGVIPPVGVGA